MRDDFEKFDKNGDGFLDKDEIKAMLEQNQLNELVGFDEEFYYCMDMNEDGKISFEGIFFIITKNGSNRSENISEWANESLAKIECMENKEDSD